MKVLSIGEHTCDEDVHINSPWDNGNIIIGDVSKDIQQATSLSLWYQFEFKLDYKNSIIETDINELNDVEVSVISPNAIPKQKLFVTSFKEGGNNTTLKMRLIMGHHLRWLIQVRV